MPRRPPEKATLGYIYKGEFVLDSILTFITALRVFCRSRSETALEILALRQQVAVLKRKRPRPLLKSLTRLFWTTLRRLCSRWADVLVIVKPETALDNLRSASCPDDRALFWIASGIHGARDT
jgi:hypothetical protein